MHVKLRPAREADRQKVYEWLARSDATAQMMGPPTFADHPVPSYDDFCDDYDKEAFAPEGNFRMFVICADDEEVGVVHYWLVDRIAELDLWIADRRHWNRGTGSTALSRVAEMLGNDELADQLIIRPSARNVRAIAAYRKAGFEDFDPDRHDLPLWCLKEGFDYEDAVVLVWPLARKIEGGAA